MSRLAKWWYCAPGSKVYNGWYSDEIPTVVIVRKDVGPMSNHTVVCAAPGSGGTRTPDGHLRLAYDYVNGLVTQLHDLLRIR